MTHHIQVNNIGICMVRRTTNRYQFKNFLNERENFFHKPLVNLNHFLELNDKTRLVLYSIGVVVQVVELVLMVVYQEHQQLMGERWYASSPWTWDWNAEIAQNSDNIDENFSPLKIVQQVFLVILSIRQDTYGLISKLNYDVVNQKLRITSSVLIGELQVLNTLVKFVIYLVEITMLIMQMITLKKVKS